MRLALRSLRFVVVPFCALGIASTAFAQSAPLPPPPSTTPVEIPPAPTVNDPMLAPVPPASKSIASWEEALAYVRSRSTDLRIAYDEVLRAEAQQRVALAGALPSVTATGNLTHNIFVERTESKLQPFEVLGADGKPVALQGGPYFARSQALQNPAVDDIGTGNLNVTQPLLALRAWHNIGTAKEAKVAAQLSMDDLKRVVALGVANALVGVVTAERIAELNRIGFRSALERLSLTQRKRALGAANGLDVIRAQQDVETARGTLVTGDESLRQSRESLGLALGMPTQIGVSASININGLEADAMRACRAAPSIDDRSDVLAARKRMDVAKRNVDDVKLQFMPTVNAATNLGAVTTPGVKPNPTWNIQALLTIPIWDGGARYGFLRDNRAQFDEAEQNLEALRRKATIEVEQARRNVKVAEDSRKVAADARALAAETDRLTQTAYREGQGTSLELVIAASALRQAEVNLALQDFNLVKARILAILALANCPW
jgi:multidrug efflux system outer membrane protein